MLLCHRPPMNLKAINNGDNYAKLDTDTYQLLLETASHDIDDAISELQDFTIILLDKNKCKASESHQQEQ